MSFRIVKREEAVFYEAPGHYDMRPTRLHNPHEVNNGKMIMGLSHFLPGGGCEYGSNHYETIYYVLEGEMYLNAETGTSEETKVYLKAGDSFHCGPGTKKSIVNNGAVTAQVLVALVVPEN